MSYTAKDLQQIVRQANTFYERVAHRDHAAMHEHMEGDADTFADAVLLGWRQIVAKEDESQLEKRFQWDNYDLRKVKQIIAGVPATHQLEIPAWLHTINRILENLNLYLGDQDQNSYRYLKKSASLPFEEILIPFIEQALQDFKSRVATKLQLLQQKPLHQLARSLLRRLSNMCVFAFKKEFDIYCAMQGFYLRSKARTHYLAFVNYMLDGALFDFFKTYPVLARLMGTAINFWLANSLRLINRLSVDLAEIRNVFKTKTALKQIKGLTMELADVHDQGQHTILLEFNNGLKLVYKPHNLAIDVAYFEFLGCINKMLGSGTPFKILQVINKGDYGWMEFVAHLPCANKKEVELYYQRCGALLCLLTILAGTDFHYENIIAHGAYPVIVDLETLLQPVKKQFDQIAERTSAILEKTVLRLSLLPHGNGVIERMGIEPSGLTGGLLGSSSAKGYQWVNINTDKMRYAQRKLKTFNHANHHLPKLCNDACLPFFYLPNILAGFTKLYNFFISNKQTSLRAGSILEVFKDIEVRYIFRPTRTYGLALDFVLRSRYLTNGMFYSAGIDTLARPLLYYQKKPFLWPLLQAEHLMMNDFDIPKFTCNSTKKYICAGSKKLANFFVTTGYQVVRNNLAELTQEDLSFQLHLIKCSLESRYAVARKQPPVAVKNKIDHKEAYSNNKFFIDTAKELADKIVAQAKIIDGNAIWFQTEIDPISEYCYLNQADYPLYNGIAGITLFLAAASKLISENCYKKVAMAGLNSLREWINAENFKFIGSIRGVGGVSGLGAIVYTLMKLSQLFNDPSLLDEANKVALLIDHDLIRKDKSLDVISGSAGAILSLLNLYEVTKEKRFLQQILNCGDYLLQNRVKSKTGHLVWHPIEVSRPLTGFAHGAAGFAYALLRLFAVSRESKYLQAAKCGIDFERAVFSPVVKKWPDLRNGYKSPSYRDSWCHGTAGIGLARIAGLHLLSSAEIEQDIEHALAAILAVDPLASSELDNLCCGNFGRIDFLLEAANRLSRPHLLQEAKKRAFFCLMHAQQQGRFSLIYNLSKDVPVLGLFSGIAGIGYELLRLCYPQQLDSVLLLQ
jgi:type 2 lantibiotic biosynthesis protein LanM